MGTGWCREGGVGGRRGGYRVVQGGGTGCCGGRWPMRMSSGRVGIGWCVCGGGAAKWRASPRDLVVGGSCGLWVDGGGGV